MALCLALHDFTVPLGLEAALFPGIFLQPPITTRDRQFPPIPAGTSSADSSLEQFPTGKLSGKGQEHGCGAAQINLHSAAASSPPSHANPQL